MDYLHIFPTGLTGTMFCNCWLVCQQALSFFRKLPMIIMKGNGRPSSFARIDPICSMEAGRIMTLQSLAAIWAERLCSTANRDDPYQKALTAYAIEGYLAMALGILLLAGVSWVAGAFWESIIVGTTAAFLKTFTGGGHVSTPIRCAIIGAVIFTTLGLVAKFYPLSSLFFPIFWIIIAICNALVWSYAPREAAGKPLSPKQKVILAWMARIFVMFLSAALIWWNDMPWRTAIFYGTTLQCLSLGSFAQNLIRLLDRCTTIIKKRLQKIKNVRRCDA